MKLSTLSSFRKGLNNDRIIHGLKTAIALLIGMLVVHLFNLPVQGRWVLISILIVMCAQSRVGAIMGKSYMRFLGTLIGACIAALTLCLAYPSVIGVTLMLCLTTALFSYVADSPNYLSEAGPVGAITVVIILTTPNPSYATALTRFVEISLGILIALLVSRFVWPFHSRTKLRCLLKNTLEDLKILFEQLRTWGSQEAEKIYETYADKISSCFANQNKLYDEVRRESFDQSNFAQVFKNIVRGEHEILRYMNLMREALIHFSGEGGISFNQQISVKKIYEASQYLFESIIDQFNANKNRYTVESLSDVLHWKDKMRKELEPLIHNAADKLAVDLFIFAADQLLIRLKKMNFLVIKV
jgi:uncharacterized membrane protein YccC